MINNELKGLNRLLLLAHAYGRFTTESEEPETRTYTYSCSDSTEVNLISACGKSNVFTLLIRC